MSKELLEPDYIEIARDSDGIESTYYELQRSKNYSDEIMYPMSRLEAMGQFWLDQLEHPYRSDRSKLECHRILDLLTFEAAYRKGKVELLRDYYSQQGLLK